MALFNMVKSNASSIAMDDKYLTPDSNTSSQFPRLTPTDPTLSSLAVMYAQALNTTAPCVSYKPLYEYPNMDAAALVMEKHISSLDHPKALDFALTLHQQITNMILHSIRNEVNDAFPESAFASGSTMPCSEGSTRFTNKAVHDEDDVGMKKINQYTLLQDLGCGRFGKVKLAVDDNDKMFAVKIVPQSYLNKAKQPAPPTQSDERVPSFKRQRSRAAAVGDEPSTVVSPMEREVQVMKKLRHRNVIRLREVINPPDSNQLYMVMDYAERGPMLQTHPDGTSVPLYFDVAKGYMKQLCEGLHYLHNHNVVHRDIKPDNILLSATGVVCFSDFGVSSFFDGTEFTRCEGTPAFHAPEICRGEKFRGPPTDIWALGVTFFMMVYGHRPFLGETYNELRNAIVDDDIVFPIVPEGVDMVESQFMGSISMQGEPGQSLDVSFASSTSTHHDTVRYGGTSVEHQEFQNLLRLMLAKEAGERPTIGQIRRHKFFRGSKFGECSMRLAKLVKNWDVDDDAPESPRTVGSNHPLFCIGGTSSEFMSMDSLGSKKVTQTAHHRM